MTRYVFMFALVNDDVACVSTTDPDIARTVRNKNWTTGASHYFTPWMDPMTGDDKVIRGGKQTRVNLVHVTAVSTYEIEDEA